MFFTGRRLLAACQTADSRHTTKHLCSRPGWLLHLCLCVAEVVLGSVGKVFIEEVCLFVYVWHKRKPDGHFSRHLRVSVLLLLQSSPVEKLEIVDSEMWASVSETNQWSIRSRKTLLNLHLPGCLFLFLFDFYLLPSFSAAQHIR